MQFYKYKDGEILNEKLHLNNKQKNGLAKNNVFWILSISIASFLLSLFLSLFSEVFLNSSNLFLAFFILLFFIALNVFSDMVGLAITSCQVTKVKKSKISKKEKSICLLLIKNSDKVSSILCDVIGDACGILCGAGSSILSIILSAKLNFSSIILSVFVSSIVVCLTVLIKAITKNYAIKNSLSIVKKCAKIFLKFKK